MKENVTISDDYAFLKFEGGQMYYGCEERNKNDDWLFVCNEDSGKRLFCATAKELGCNKGDAPEVVLLAGISKVLDMAMKS